MYLKKFISQLFRLYKKVISWHLKAAWYKDVRTSLDVLSFLDFHTFCRYTNAFPLDIAKVFRKNAWSYQFQLAKYFCQTSQILRGCAFLDLEY